MEHFVQFDRVALTHAVARTTTDIRKLERPRTIAVMVRSGTDAA